MSDESPFRPEHFRKYDESDDARFYVEPRFVAHIDDTAIAALSEYYAQVLKPEHRVLDLMSSWISHLPAGYQSARAVGLGMNADELSRNPALDDWVVHDLNREPTLPFDNASFDAVLIAVSVQYLQRPLEVFAEIARVLEPGGLCVVSFSNRCFPTKAVALWQGLNMLPHLVRSLGLSAKLAAEYSEPSTHLTVLHTDSTSSPTVDTPGGKGSPSSR